MDKLFALAIDSIEFTMLTNGYIRIGLLVIIALVILKLFVSIIQQIINLLKK